MFLPKDRAEGDGGVVSPSPPPLQTLLLLGGGSKKDEPVLSIFTSNWCATNQDVDVALLAITVIRIWLQVIPLALMTYLILHSVKCFITRVTHRPTVGAFGKLYFVHQ